jgi:hypothetical protein
MAIRHITVDYAGNIYEVTNLMDRNARDTDIAAEATACVIKLGEDRWLPEDTANVPIYTVH